LSGDDYSVDAYHDDEPLRYCTLDNIFGDQPFHGLAIHDFEAELHLAHEDGEPRSYAEAEGHGMSTLFWTDNWLQGKSLLGIVPRICLDR
jgi:hypothetical protein